MKSGFLLLAAKIPDLRPPLDLVGPTFWERYGALIFLLTLFLTVGVIVLVRWKRPPRPVVVVPPETVTRNALAARRGRAEDRALASEVSRIMRHYLLATFHIPVAEMSTEEIAEALRQHPVMEAELLDNVKAFLYQCDARQFAPTLPVASVSIITRALELVAEVEAFQRRFQLPVAPVPLAATAPAPTA